MFLRFRLMASSQKSTQSHPPEIEMGNGIDYKSDQDHESPSTLPVTEHKSDPETDHELSLHKDAKTRSHSVYNDPERERIRDRVVDPFDPKYANVPLDVPIARYNDYVARKNSRNDQDHLHSQIMFFKKEFGNLRGGKSAKSRKTSRSTSS